MTPTIMISKVNPENNHVTILNLPATQDMVSENPMETLGDEMEGSGDEQMQPMVAEEPSMLSRVSFFKINI